MVVRFHDADDPRGMFAERLDRSFDASVSLFHHWGGVARPVGEPSRPGGDRVVDHVVIASSGLWVVLAEDATGRVASNAGFGAGGGRGRLVVGDVDHSAVLDAARERAAEFAAQLDDIGVSVAPVQPVVCLLLAEWDWFARPVMVDGVLVTWPSELIDDIKGGHWWDPPTVARVTERVATTAPAQATAG